MLKITRRIGGIPAACALALAALAPAAPGQAPKPEPCGGTLLIADAAGDQTYKAQGQDVGPAPANTDTGGLFFRVDDGKVTANIVMEDLNLTVPDGFEAIRNRVYFTIDGTVRYLQALVTADGVAYTYGSELELVYTKDGDTTGAVFEGKKGVIQIVLPPDAGGTPGTKLDATSASIGLLTVGGAPEESHLPPVYFGVDTAPDDSEDGPSTTPEACPVAPGDTPPNTPTDPNAGNQPPQQTQPPARTELQLTLARASLAAKKANKKRAASFGLKSNETLTELKVQLKRGSKVMGAGTLARLASSGSVKVKLKRKLKKGTHTLLVTGKRSDGSAFSKSLRLRVTR